MIERLADAAAVSVFWAKVDRRGPDECWPWAGPRQDNDYGYFDWAGKRWGAHDLALAFTFGRPRPDGHETRHSCHNPPCCNPAHLSYGTPSQNRQDSAVAGRLAAPNATLTEAEVVEIRNLRAGGATVTELALRYGVKKPAISRICSGARWPMAGGPITPPRHRTERTSA